MSVTRLNTYGGDARRLIIRRRGEESDPGRLARLAAQATYPRDQRWGLSGGVRAAFGPVNPAADRSRSRLRWAHTVVGLKEETLF